MKKITRLTFITALALIMLFALTACHSHKAEEDWLADAESHWRECSCGEIMEAGDHSLEDGICTVCSAQLVDEGDGYYHVAVNNEQGDCTSAVYYDDEGNIYSSMKGKYVYDENGNKLKESFYTDGVLTEEGEYAVNDKGESYRITLSEWDEEGNKYVYKYDEKSNITGCDIYDAEGELLSEMRYEYDFDDEGNVITEKIYENDILSQQVSYTTADTELWGEITYASATVYYSEDGSSYEEIYDENGDIVGEKSYNSEGELEYEYTCVNEYDEDGNLISVKRYEGETLAYESRYEYDDNGNHTKEKTYENGVLIDESEYTESDGYIYESKQTVYYEDGSKSVYELDEYGEIIKEENFDSQGNIIK